MVVPAPCSPAPLISCKSRSTASSFSTGSTPPSSAILRRVKSATAGGSWHRDLRCSTPREREILELVFCVGKAASALPALSEISPKTVEAHRAHITKKLNVRSFNEITGKIFGKMISDALHAIQRHPGFLPSGPERCRALTARSRDPIWNLLRALRSAGRVAQGREP